MTDKFGLDSELVQLMFYGSENQILTPDNIRGSIESFLFDNLKIESNPFVSTVRHGLAGNIITLLEGLGFLRLQEGIKKATGSEREKLADQQIALIGQAVALKLSESTKQPEKMMLEVLQG